MRCGTSATVFGQRDVHLDARGPQRLDVFAAVLLRVGEDEVGRQIQDAREVGRLRPPDARKPPEHARSAACSSA